MEGIPNHTADDVNLYCLGDCSNMKHLVTISASDGIICDRRVIEILVQPTDQ